MSRVLLIGLDGATFGVLDELTAAGLMPRLAEVGERGARAQLLSTPHPFTPPAWTSLMTGSNPGGHGIFDFVRVLPGEERPQYSMATSRDVRREMIWSIASRYGRRADVLNFPLMFPPRPLNGHVVPGFVPPRHLRRFVYPEEFYERLLQLPGFDPKELLLDMDIERESLQTLEGERYEDWLELHIRREAQWAAIAGSLLGEAEGPDLLAVLFDGVDKVQHLCWRYLDPKLEPPGSSAFDQRVLALCRRYFSELDRHIADLIDAAGDDVNVVICSDHGFGATSEIFYANVLLARHGYLRFADRVEPDSDGRQMTEGHRNPTVLFDWERTRAYALTAGSNGIYLRDDDDELREEIELLFTEYIDPETGERPVATVLRREEAFPGEHCRLAPDLTLILRDHGFLSILNADAVVKKRERVMGTHAPEGVFLGSGPALRTGALSRDLRIEEIAPLVLHLLDVPIPTDFETGLPEDAFDPSWLAEHEPGPGIPTIPPNVFFEQAPAVLDAAGEGQVLERLRALGYVE